MAIGELLRSLRIEEGLTMKELGLKVGVTEQAISQYERGKREPNDEILIKILKAFNVNLEPYIKRIVGIDPIWENSLSYLKNLIDYCEKTKELNLLDLNYITVYEVSNFINKNVSYIEKLTKNHVNSSMPTIDSVAMRIEEKEELVIELNSQSSDDNYDNDVTYKNDYSVKESLDILHFETLMEDLNLKEFKRLSKESLLNIIHSKELNDTLKYLLSKEIQK
jgi:transcriptional regulator with XRE-family HTH domain